MQHPSHLISAMSALGEVKVVGWVVAIAAIAVALAWIANVPVSRARRRGYSNLMGIAVLAWAGVAIWPLWIVAMLMSSGGRWRRQQNVARPWVRVSCPPRVRQARGDVWRPVAAAAGVANPSPPATVRAPHPAPRIVQPRSSHVPDAT